MTTDDIPSEDQARKSTSQLLVKVKDVSCLYRHKINGTYYGRKKFHGKRKDHSLETTDKEVAKRKLAAWIKGLGKIDPETEKTTLAQLIIKFEAANVGNPDKGTDDSMIKRFKETWQNGLDIRVSKVKPSQLDTWLATECKNGEWKNSTYNKYCTFLNRLFAIAKADKMIDESPMIDVKTSWKKPQKPDRHCPTIEQFNAIVADIRAQKLNADAEDSADFIEFMGNAGLGQAEIKPEALTWDDVNWQRNEISILRQKTGQRFPVPIYPNLKPLLERLNAKPHKPHDAMLKLADAKKALAGACKRLGFFKDGNKPRFSQRNIRAVQIRRLWQKKVDLKLIAKWQGHQDGGRLILSTYTEIFGDNDAEYIKTELAKLV